MNKKTLSLGAMLLVVLGGCTERVPEAEVEGKWIYRDTGAIQCESEGLSLAEMRQQLDNAGIEVRDSACGSDGLMRTTVCGAPAGRIGLFEIALTDLGGAQELGFEQLDRLPQATQTPCREGELPAN